MSEKIDYIEFSTKNLPASRAFFESAFGWQFTAYDGGAYLSFSSSAGIDGGFYAAPKSSSTADGGALVVLCSDDLEATQATVEENGGTVVRAIFSFPGGRRFHFTEPGGNELAVWSDR